MLLRPKETHVVRDYNDIKDLYFVAYNSFYRDHKALSHVMKLQQDYICRPSFGKKSICVLFFYTDVTNEVMNQFLEQLEQCKDNIEKVAIVGVPVNSWAWFKLKAARKGSDLAPYQFFFNAKAALDWLHHNN